MAIHFKMVGYQLDDSQSLHRKWLEITKHLFINGCLEFQEQVMMVPQTSTLIKMVGKQLDDEPNLYEWEMFKGILATPPPKLPPLRNKGFIKGLLTIGFP